jgi:serine/threonine protein phosphatase PrpC
VNKTNNKSSTLSNNNSAISNNKVNKNNCTINNSNNNTIKTNTKITENKKIVRNINFNTSSKSNLQENIKNISHELKPQPKTQAKEDKDKDKDKEKIVSNEKKQKKSMIQGIKILDIKNNSSVKDSENVSRALPKNKIIDISENNTSRKRQIQNASSKSLEDDIDYFKEVADIMYENNTEPRNQIKYNVKENDIDKKIKFTKGRSGQISEAKIERRFGLQNINENKEKVNTNENSATKGISNIKNNDNNFNTISTSKESIINNRRYSSDIILINNSLKAFNELKRNNSNSKMNNKLIIAGTDNKKNDLSNHIKMNSSKNHSNFKLEFLEDKNKQKLQNQSKVSKYESISKRVIDIPKIENKEEKNDDEWDNEQYMGMRQKKYDVGLRLVKKSRFLNKAKKDSSLNNEFSSQTYLKSSDGISIAGKNEYGLKKTNQDTYLIERNINGILNFNIFGVLDGHGENGHFASQFVSRYILHRIKTHPSLKKEDEPKQIYHKLKENGYEIIANIFVDADVQIQKEKFNVDRSGTTCVIVIQLEEHIICANTGDSRAIIVFDENHDDNLVNSKIYPLSYDCKPELPNELARIIAYGGCVERAYDVENAECGPFRVWAKDKDYPGLAMSRSIGDMDAKKIGVIPNPQIVEYTIDHSSKYLILASDGIWEFIDSEDAMKYSNKYYIRNDPIGLCHDLSKRATALWEKNDCIIDDITVLVVFF